MIQATAIHTMLDKALSWQHLSRKWVKVLLEQLWDVTSKNVNNLSFDAPWISWVLAGHCSSKKVILELSSNCFTILPLSIYPSQTDNPSWSYSVNTVPVAHIAFIGVNIQSFHGQKKGEEEEDRDAEGDPSGDVLPSRHCNLLYKLHVRAAARLKTSSSMYQSPVNCRVNFLLTLVLWFITLLQIWHCQSKL